MPPQWQACAAVCRASHLVGGFSEGLQQHEKHQTQPASLLEVSTGTQGPQSSACTSTSGPSPTPKKRFASTSLLVQCCELLHFGTTNKQKGEGFLRASDVEWHVPCLCLDAPQMALSWTLYTNRASDSLCTVSRLERQLAKWYLFHVPMGILYCVSGGGDGAGNYPCLPPEKKARGSWLFPEDHLVLGNPIEDAHTTNPTPIPDFLSKDFCLEWKWLLRSEKK